MERDIPPMQNHGHVFGQDRKRPGESRTLIVIAITAAMMGVEFTAGVLFGSMALLADGLHMASHAAALSVSFFAYIYARRHARDPRYSFGTGKVNALAGFSGAILLALFALLMSWESLKRMLHPVEIEFNHAILVAVLGLGVNGVCVLILGARDHDHGPSHDHSHDHGRDHNLRSAYLHVLADALTSILAIFALLSGKWLNWIWMDPLMGILGAILVARWSLGLLRATAGVLLDRQGPEPLRQAIAGAVESDGDSRVTDLHLWSIGPGLYAVILEVAASAPAPPDVYKSRLPLESGLVHVTVEVHVDPVPSGSEPGPSPA